MLIPDLFLRIYIKEIMTQDSPACKSMLLNLSKDSTEVYIVLPNYILCHIIVKNLKSPNDCRNVHINSYLKMTMIDPVKPDQCWKQSDIRFREQVTGKVTVL